MNAKITGVTSNQKNKINAVEFFQMYENDTDLFGQKPFLLFALMPGTNDSLIFLMIWGPGPYEWHFINCFGSITSTYLQ